MHPLGLSLWVMHGQVKWWGAKNPLALSLWVMHSQVKCGVMTRPRFAYLQLDGESLREGGFTEVGWQCPCQLVVSHSKVANRCTQQAGRIYLNHMAIKLHLMSW